MNKQLLRKRLVGYSRVRQLLRTPVLLRFVVVAWIAATGWASFSQPVEIAAAVTADAYCNQFVDDDSRNACKDGISGVDCSEYEITSGAEIAAKCRQAQKAKQSGEVTGTPSYANTANNDPCNNYNGILQQACQGGKVYGCNPSTRNSDPELYSACQAGSGEDINSLFYGSNQDDQTYKSAILLSCQRYQYSPTASAACLYGGLGADGTGNKPLTRADCLTNSAFRNSAAQNACMTGAQSASSYQSALNSGNYNPNNNPFGIFDQLDQSNGLSDYIDRLHATGSDAGVDTSLEADDTYGSYVNGAGKKQPIKVTPGHNCADNAAAGAAEGGSRTVRHATNVNGFTEITEETISGGLGGGGCPGIIIMNGGGWHTNDGMSDKFAAGAPADNNQEGPRPAGGGANERGYTVIEVTYRLGSSSVYYAFEDVMRGIQHVINNADQYGVDPTKLAIMGDSAGGSLAMRAAASGVSGAKVAVGWSAPTNALTALFKSYKTFMIGMDHSTCAPTDLAGLTNTLDLLNGGSGEVSQYGQGISSNDFSALGFSQEGAGGIKDFDPSRLDAVSSITQVLTAAQYAQQTSQRFESISRAVEQAARTEEEKKKALEEQKDTDQDGKVSEAEELEYQAKLKKFKDTDKDGEVSAQEEAAYQQQIDAGGTYNPVTEELENQGQELAAGFFNLSAKKMGECWDNFQALSPALFASPETPPVFLAGYDNDDLIDPQQLYDMRDKVLQLGGKAEALVLPGNPNAAPQAFGATENHLGYHPDFVCKTINFIDEVIQPDKEPVECDKNVDPNAEQSEETEGSESSDGESSGNTGDQGTSEIDCNNFISDGRQDLTAQREGCEAAKNGVDCSNFISDGRQDLSAQKKACETAKGTPSTGNNGGTPTGCPDGLVPGSHACVPPINNNSSATPPQPPAPGAGKTFTITNTANAGQVNAATDRNCPSKRADSIGKANGEIIFRCR